MRIVSALALALSLLVLLATAASADTGAKIIERCTHGQSLSGFSQKDYRRALAELPTEVEEYSDCGNLIRRAQLAAAEFAIDAPGVPQILITIAARFDRTAWKYSSIAYSLVLKDAGVLTQTLYLMATDMGLGGCAIGSIDIDLFSKMTGLEFHIEGPVGQFALGRGRKTESPD
jgi:nitroreductase